MKVGERSGRDSVRRFSKRIYTFNAKTQDATVVDAATGKVVGTVPLGGKPERVWPMAKATCS